MTEIGEQLPNSTECGICYDECDDSTTKNICCSSQPHIHRYHTTCLQQWIATNVKNNSKLGDCPSCRSRLNISGDGWQLLTDVFSTSLKTAQKKTQEAMWTLTNASNQLKQKQINTLDRLIGRDIVKNMLQRNEPELDDGAIEEILNDITTSPLTNNYTARYIEGHIAETLKELAYLEYVQALERENIAVKNMFCITKLEEIYKQTKDLEAENPGYTFSHMTHDGYPAGIEILAIIEILRNSHTD